jgi:hypothetical protein
VPPAARAPGREGQRDLRAAGVPDGGETFVSSSSQRRGEAGGSLSRVAGEGGSSLDEVVPDLPGEYGAEGEIEIRQLVELERSDASG